MSASAPRARERLIVALDVPSAARARHLVRRLGEAVGFYKVGHELFTAEGPDVVEELVSAGKQVFLDMKYHDIPRTVAAGVKTAAGLRAGMVTVHAAGGASMLRAAVEAAGQAKHPPLVLAVTVLTSLSAEDLRLTGISESPLEQVLRLAELAQVSGCHGVVASPLEVARLRGALGPDMVIVTPGIRPSGSAAGDQTRLATPAQAISSGADYLVIGRPIVEAARPSEAARAILAEIAGCL